MMPTNKLTIATVTSVILVPLATLFAQNPEPEEDTPWIGVVITKSASIRCGANESYYPVATAKSGDLVRVLGKRQDWLKIETAGEVFTGVIGYVKYPSQDTSVFAVVGDSGAARSDIEVLAKNIDSNELYRSWRPVLHLHDGEVVRVLKSIITEPGTLHRNAYVVHTIQMPSNATVWVNATNINPATKEQIATFTSSAKTVQIETNGVQDNSGTPTIVTTIGDRVGYTVDDANKTMNETLVSDTTGTLETIGAEPLDKLVPFSITELEAAWEKIAKEPVMGAEVSPLRDMYADLLVAQKDDLVVARIASGRIKQLDVWSDLQEQKIRIEVLRADLELKTKRVTDYQDVFAMYDGYAIVGKLALSNTFDGRLRPLMYRIQDQKSGRTLGYLPTNKDWELSGLIGQTIGIVGKNSWDPHWMVNVVRAKRFDILSPTTAIVPIDIQ